MKVQDSARRSDSWMDNLKQQSKQVSARVVIYEVWSHMALRCWNPLHFFHSQSLIAFETISVSWETSNRWLLHRCAGAAVSVQNVRSMYYTVNNIYKIETIPTARKVSWAMNRTNRDDNFQLVVNDRGVIVFNWWLSANDYTYQICIAYSSTIIIDNKTSMIHIHLLQVSTHTNNTCYRALFIFQIQSICT